MSVSIKKIGIGALLSCAIGLWADGVVDPVEMLSALPKGISAEVVIPPGIYRLPEAGLKLDGLQDVKVMAEGVTFLATNPKGTAVRLDNCVNLTLQGLTIDYDPLPFTQATLTSIDPQQHTADFTVHAGYPDLTDEYLVRRFHLFEKDAHRWKPGTPDYYINKMERLTPRTGRVYLRSTDSGFASLEVGDRVVFNIRAAAALNIQSGCKDVTLEDVTVHAGPGVAIMVRFAENAGVLRNVRVVPGPLPAGATEERLMSSSADAFNAAYTRKGPLLEGCEFAYMGDDSINLHGATLPVLLWENPRTCISMRPFHTDPFEKLLHSGDEVRFLSEPEYRVVQTAKIVNISSADEPSGIDLMTKVRKIWPSFKRANSAAFYRVVLDQDIHFEADGLFFEAFASSAPGYTVKNCYFHDHRGRGLRVMSGNGLVESNRFERLKGAAMSFGPEFAYWKEAGWVENVTVRGNVIRDVGQGKDLLSTGSYTLGAISVYAHVKPGHAQTAYYPGNRALTIVDNDIDGCSLDGINVVASQNVLIENNTIRRVNLKSAPGAGSKYGLSSGAPITFQHSESVTVQNNDTEEKWAE